MRGSIAGSSVINLTPLDMDWTPLQMFEVTTQQYARRTVAYDCGWQLRHSDDQSVAGRSQRAAHVSRNGRGVCLWFGALRNRPRHRTTQQNTWTNAASSELNTLSGHRRCCRSSRSIGGALHALSKHGNPIICVAEVPEPQLRNRWLLMDASWSDRLRE